MHLSDLKQKLVNSRDYMAEARSCVGLRWVSVSASVVWIGVHFPRCCSKGKASRQPFCIHVQSLCLLFVRLESKQSGTVVLGMAAWVVREEESGGN